MAKKRRRRQQYKTRPPKSRSPETDDPSLPSQQFEDATAPVETAPYAPVAPPAAAGVGMPVAAALGQQPSAANPDMEEQGYARGGAIALPGGFGNFPSVQSDPVARRRYSPRHVGYAEGGEVDPMGYVPDRPMPSTQPQQPQFDPYNLVGRQEPIILPYAAVRPETGYAKGGPVAAAQVPAYTDPVYPPPSAENAKLYATMDAARERTINPPPLPSRAPAPWQNPSSPEQTDPWAMFRGTTGISSKQSVGPYRYAEGGEVQGGSAAPDAEGYLRGDNAMDPQELDGILQQIAQLDPNQSEDVVNLTAIVQAAQSGDMDRASSILAGFRRRFDRLNASAQGAAAHGDMAAAAQLAGKAHSQVPDGMTVAYAVAPEGNVTATVSPSNASFTMDWQQFHDYLVGPATSFDHILENGLEKNLAIASGGRSGQQASGENPAPTGYAEGGEVTDDGQAAQLEEERRRQAVTDVLEHTRQRHGLTPAGGRTALEEGVGLPREPAGGRTALSRGVGYEGPAGGQTAYQAGQARRPGPQTDEPAGGKTAGGDFLQRLKSGLGFGDGEGTAPASSRRGTPVAEPAAAAEPRMGARPVPGPASASRGVEYPEKLPGEDILVGPGGPASSARRGVGTRPVAAAPEPQQLGSREDISLPPAAQPAAGRQPLPANASAAEVNAALKAAHAAAAERGDIYTTPRWSWDRLTKEGIPDIMQGKVFGRNNTVDYPADVLARRDELAQQNREAARQQPARDTSPVDVEQRRAEAIQSRGQPQPSGGQPSRQQVEPHEQRMRDIDQQQQQLRQPIAPAGSFASQPKSYEGKSGVDRYNKEVVADQHRYNNEVHQRSAQIAEQRQQDQTIIRAFNDARKEGADTPELKDAYDAAMYRVSGGKLRIPKVEQPVTKKEEPGIMQRIFGGNSQAKPATMGGYGSPGTPPRAPQRGMTWYYSPSTGQFEERPQ